MSQNESQKEQENQLSTDISVVVNIYKRPENLVLQLEALENQSIKPKEIMVFQDPVASGDPVSFPEHLRDRFDVVEISPENVGVWGRFRFAQKAKSPLVCILDDDTVPGSKWLENCHQAMQNQEGLYGTIGVVMLDPKTYPKDFISVGWKNPNKKTVPVDFVGHAWFFKKEWLQDLLETPKEIQDLRICGEDMSFSFQLLQKRGIQTFVPPHPGNQEELFGSIPKYGRPFGKSDAALSQSKESRARYNKAMQLLQKQGWKTVVQHEESLSPKVLKVVYEGVKILCAPILHQGWRRRARGVLLSLFLPKEIKR